MSEHEGGPGWSNRVSLVAGSHLWVKLHLWGWSQSEPWLHQGSLHCAGVRTPASPHFFVGVFFGSQNPNPSRTLHHPKSATLPEIPTLPRILTSPKSRNPQVLKPLQDPRPATISKPSINLRTRNRQGPNYPLGPFTLQGLKPSGTLQKTSRILG